MNALVSVKGLTSKMSSVLRVYRSKVADQIMPN